MSQRLSYQRPEYSGPRQHLRLVCLLVCVVLLRVAITEADNLRRIVEFKAGTPVAVQKQIVEASGSTLLHVLPLVNAVVIKLPADRVQVALELLRRYSEVEQIHVDSSVSAQGLRSDVGIEGSLIKPAAPPQETYPWNLRQIFLDQADPTVQGAGVRVAVIDTGIDATHPALAGAVIGGYNALAEEPEVPQVSGVAADGEGPDGEGPDGTASLDCNGHGTHIAGIIAADTVGIAPAAQLYAVRVLDCRGEGFVSDLIAGLSWVYDHPDIRVINMSLGFYRSDRELYPLFHKVIKKLHEAGVIMVASAGNYRSDCIPAEARASSEGLRAAGEGPDGEGPDGDGSASGSSQQGCNTRVKFPARYPETIAVAASDINAKIAYYSIRSPEVVVTGPGGTIQDPVISTATSVSATTTASAANGVAATGEGGDGEGGDGEGGDGEGGDGLGAYGQGSGTSQAAAHLAGVATLMLSTNPALTPAAVRTILQETAEPLDASMSAQGYGLVNAALAVEWARSWKDLEVEKKERKGRTRIHKTASINESADIGASVKIEKNVVIEAEVSIGDGTKIEKNVVIETGVSVGDGAKIDKNVLIEAGASVGDGTKVEKNVVIEADAALGEHTKVGQDTVLGGSVTVGDGTVIRGDVLINTSSTVGKDVTVGTRTKVGAVGHIMDGSLTSTDVTLGEYVTIGYDTLIHRGVSIGNSVAIGHYVEIESGVRIGDDKEPNIYSTTIGDDTVIKRGVTIGRNVKIGSNVVIGQGAVLCDGVVVEDNTKILPDARVGCD